jgi:hypothetical protein
LRIFDDAGTKLKAWYKYYPDAGNPNSSYRLVLKARSGATSNVDANGNVSRQRVELIERTLRGPFKMGRQMDDAFGEKLGMKLQKDNVRTALRKMMNLHIGSINHAAFEPDARTVYETLSSPGKDGLSAREDAFCVGATKIMHFLFPEFFIMLDQYAAKGVGLRKFRNFEAYWSALELCHKELEEWHDKHGSIDNLLAMDVPPTTPTRIFDKCAFVMGHPCLVKIYEVLTHGCVR